MKKLSSVILLVVITLFITTGCEENTNTSTTTGNTNNKVISNGEKVNTKKMKHKHCTRSATAGSNTEMILYYDVYYTGEDINILFSHEELITNDTKMLDQYEDAYKKIANYYVGLEYYDQNVKRTSTSIINETTINYEKIDIKKLLDIEGEEDNIVKDGKAKVDLYIDLLEQFGGKCEDVE